MAKSTLKSEIAPKGLNFKTTQFNIGDKFATIYTVVEFPQVIGPGYLSNISSIPGAKVVVKHIPIELAVMQKAINKEVAELKEEYQKENDFCEYESQESYTDSVIAAVSFRSEGAGLLLRRWRLGKPGAGILVANIR